LTLADGTTIENLRLNGNNFVSEEKIDESIFEDNLTHVTATNSNGDVEYEFNNAELVQQVHYDDGWYFVLRELSAAELRELAIDAKIDYIAMMTDVDMED
jgi:hypothetical protein